MLSFFSRYMYALLPILTAFQTVFIHFLTGCPPYTIKSFNIIQKFFQKSDPARCTDGCRIQLQNIAEAIFMTSEKFIFPVIQNSCIIRDPALSCRKCRMIVECKIRKIIINPVNRNLRILSSPRSFQYGLSSSQRLLEYTSPFFFAIRKVSSVSSPSGERNPFGVTPHTFSMAWIPFFDGAFLLFFG